MSNQSNSQCICNPLKRNILEWIFKDYEKPNFTISDIKKIKEEHIGIILTAICNKDDNLTGMIVVWFIMNLIEFKDFENYDELPPVGVSNDDNKQYFQNSIEKGKKIIEIIREKNNLEKKIL
jgi:hypothetical protein